jgi:GAF domain-containing protein
LAATRAELVVPLHRGKQVFGVLDAQSVNAEAFSGPEINALETIAAQLSLAIDNTRLTDTAHESSTTQQRLNDQLQNAMRQIERLNQVGSAQTWSRFIESRGEGIIGLDWKEGIFTPNQALTPTLERAMSSTTPEIRIEGSDQVMTVPILSRGQILGVMEFRAAGRRTWNDRSLELARAISQRLALALDNVRLFEQAQALASREQTVNQIASQLQAKTDIDSLLTTAAESFQQALGATRTSIRLGTSDQIGGKNGGSKS